MAEEGINIEDLMGFDPFSKPPEGEAPGPVEEPTPPTEPPAGVVAPVEPPAAPIEPPAPVEPPAAAPVTPPTGAVPPAEPPAPAPAPDPALEAMRVQNELLTQTLQRMQQPAEPVSDPAAAAAPAVPPYNFNVPDELLAHMRSEDPNEVRTGLAAFAQGVAQTVHRTVMQEFTDQMGSVVPQYVQQSVSSVQQQQEVFNDFYQVNKDLNLPELRPLVVSVAQQVASETGANAWSPQLRDAIASRVRGVLRGNAPPPVAPTPAPPPASFGGSARPGETVSPDKVQEDISRTLFG